MPNFAITTTAHDLEPKAKNLAERLAIPFTLHTTEFDYYLQLTPEHLELIKNTPKTKPFYIDFLSGKMTYRRQHATFRNEILVRALGLKNHTQPKIVDATAGLARDSFILASLGFEITLLERSPIIHALLEDALTHARKNPETSSIAARMNLIRCDATHWLTENPEQPDIIYLDPMFPERTKKAAVKKEMVLFQDIVGEDLDAEELLKTALACAAKRVVVKRPRLAEPVGGKTPNFTMTGSSSRFDVYLMT